MEIKVCTTLDWNDYTWETYVNSFNIVFDRSYDVSHFKHKYLNVRKKYSYHALLLDQNKRVVGGCSVIPFKYKNGSKNLMLGQAVDVFILEKYRKDPLTLRKMYLQLKQVLIADDIKAVVAVPNKTAYTYWKKIVKWRDVGDLDYWLVPVRVGSILNKWRFLNSISTIIILVFIKLNYFLSIFINAKQGKSIYKLDVDNNFNQYRYTDDYIEISSKDIKFYYRMYSEGGVNTAYLFDFRQDNKMTLKSMSQAVSYIVTKTDADAIIFIGSMKFFQSIFLKVPRKLVPKRLPFTCDILIKDDSDEYSNMFDLKNWDYSLKNFDVR